MAAAASKLSFSVLGPSRCSETVHPWTASCASYFLRTLLRSFLGSLRVFAAVYGIPALLRARQEAAGCCEARGLLLAAALSAARSAAFTAADVSVSLGLTCVFRRLLGEFRGHTTALVPTLLATLSVLIEDRARWDLTEFSLTNSMLERLLLQWERARGRRLRPAALTALFCAASGLLLALLRAPAFRRLAAPGDALWFFYPPAVKADGDGRSEEDGRPLYKHFVSAARLLAIGALLQAARAVLRDPGRPGAAARRLLRPDTYRLGLFLGGYAALYKAASLLLRRLRGGCDHPLLALPAGVLAGAAFRLYPDPALGLTALTAALQLLRKRAEEAAGAGPRARRVRQLAAVCVLTALQVHAYFVDPAACSAWFVATLEAVSGGTTRDLRERFVRLWHVRCFPVALAGL